MLQGSRFCLPTVGKFPHIQVDDGLAFVANQNHNELALALHHKNGVLGSFALNDLQNVLVVLEITNFICGIAVSNDALHQPASSRLESSYRRLSIQSRTRAQSVGCRQLPAILLPLRCGGNNPCSQTLPFFPPCAFARS